MFGMMIYSWLLSYSNGYEESEVDATWPRLGTDVPLTAARMETFGSVEDPVLGTKENPIHLDDSEMRSEISDGDTTIPFTDCSEEGDSPPCSRATGYGAKGSLHEPTQDPPVIMWCGSGEYLS